MPWHFLKGAVKSRCQQSSTVAWSSGSCSLCAPNSTLGTFATNSTHLVVPVGDPRATLVLTIFPSSAESRTIHLYVCMYAQSLSCVWLSVAPWIIACLAPLSMGCSRQEYQSRLPFPTPGNLPNPGTEPMSLPSPPLAGRFFTTSATWEAPYTW